MAFSGLQKTRLGLSAFARGLYGSFAGKSEAITVPAPGFGVGSVMSNNGLGLESAINNEGVGKAGSIQLGFGVGSVMTNKGIGVEGLINNEGVGEALARLVRYDD
jgi:hypothetical protein